MSTEPRRIRKIVRREMHVLAETGVTTTQKPFAYALQKVRVVPGYVTLPQLAAERGIQAQLARLWVKNAGIKRPVGKRWVWKEGHVRLKQVREALGLKT